MTSRNFHAAVLTAVLIMGILGRAPSTRAQGTTPSGTSAETPSFTELLARSDLTLEDLSLDVPPDGLTLPLAASVPHLPPHVAGMRRDPRQLVLHGSNLLAVLERVMPEEKQQKSSSEESGRPGEVRESRLLPVLTAFLLHSLEPAGFRGFEPPTPELPVGPGALTAMLERLRREPPPGSGLGSVAGLAPVLHPVPPVTEPLPEPSEEEAALPAALGAPLARLLARVAVATEAVEGSWWGVDRRVLALALEPPAPARPIPLLLPGGAVGWPALERLVDGEGARSGATTRAAAFLDLALAVERAVAELREIAVPEGFDLWQVETPRGRVVVAGAGGHQHRCRRDCLLVVDLGGDDHWLGTAGGAVFPAQPVAVALDLAGDDRWDGAPAGEQDVAQGAGLGGLGIAVDAAGDERYTAGDRAQGFGLLGWGLLWDLAGPDSYRAGGGAQGAGVFGGGALVDGDGDDLYHVLGEGQGFGGPGGAGALVDLAGSDDYTAEVDPAIRTPLPGEAGDPDVPTHSRADYHSENRVAANNAQGAGVGRRGDLTDGHSWAGGRGVLADRSGDDTYRAGNFAQGLGYHWGTGLLLDGAGDDLYRSVYFSQGSAAHFSQALLLERSGDDRHLLGREAAAGLAYGWDFALAILVDGGGDDEYQASNTALGTAERNSVALFLELGGDDDYRVPPPDGAGRRTFGARDPCPGLHTGDPHQALTAASLAPLVGWFLDLGGEDTYPPTPAAAAAAPSPPSAPREDRSWHWPGPCGDGDAPASRARVGAGLDIEAPTPAHPAAWLLGLRPVTRSDRAR